MGLLSRDDTSRWLTLLTLPLYPTGTPLGVNLRATMRSTGDRLISLRASYLVLHMRRIVSTVGTNSGSPRIDGTRWTCANVVGSMWYNSYSVDQFLAEFETDFGSEDVISCLNYCAKRQCVASSVHSYCEHCTLDVEWGKQMAAENEQAILAGLDPPNESQENYWEFAIELLKKHARSDIG